MAESAVHARESLGLLGMQERAQLFGGHVTFQTAPGRGTTVSVSIPLSQRSDY
jgi:signal transduction histidine kinase